MIVLIAMCSSLFAFQGFECLKLGAISPKFIKVISLLLPSVAVVIIHFLLSRSFMKISMHFAPIQSIFFLICSMEMSIITTPLAETMDGFSAVSALLASLSMIGYNQKYQFYSTLFNICYTLFRTYNWIPLIFKYIRFNIYFLITFLFTYGFGRAFHKIQRDKFVASMKQKHLLEIFQELVKVYHDGILITSFGANEKSSDDDKNQDHQKQDDQKHQIQFYNKKITELYRS